MKQYILLIEHLKGKGIEFERGLSEQEFSKIEEVYEFQFPTSYKCFLALGVPIGSGFYNWRDLSSSNVKMIKNKMEIPFLDIKKYCNEIDQWPIAFGKKPKSEKELEKRITLLLKNAPILIPVYSHRYMPISSIKNPPFFSVYGIDIIYYGEDLIQYLKIEFGIIDYSEMHNNMEYIEFWSETINW